MTNPSHNYATILGLDLSLASTGAVVIPCGWDGDWKKTHRATFGRELPARATDLAHIQRLEFVADQIVEFAHANGCSYAAIESHPWGKSKCAHSLGALSGVARVALHRAGIEVAVVPISSARKLLLGALPRKSAKIAVHEHLTKLGATMRTMDESDAFCAANYLSAQLGGAYFEGGRLWFSREQEAAS